MFVFQAHNLPLNVIRLYIERFPGAKLNLLRAYGKPSNENSLIFGRCRHLINKLILDSGAWTMNNSSKPQFPITLEGYIGYLEQTYSFFDFVMNLDEDFSKTGFDKNYSNQLAIEAAGFETTPVVHDLQGDELDFYIKRGHKTIAIGSGELERPDYDMLYPIFRKCYDQGVKIHALGSVRYNPYAFMPVYSCDSSNWNQAGGRGYLFWWNRKKPGIDKTDRVFFEDHYPLTDGRVYFLKYDYQNDPERYLERELRLSYTALMGNDRYLNRQLANLHYYVELEKRMTAKQRELGFVFDD